MASTDSVTFTFRDYSKELSSVRIPTAPLTDGNIVGQLAALVTLESAVDGISLGVLAKRKLTTRDEVISNAIAASTTAQVENKWLVTYESTVTGKKYQCEIPCADTALLQTNSDLMDISANAGLTFKTAFEAFATTPDVSDDSVEILSVRLVGRNR